MRSVPALLLTVLIVASPAAAQTGPSGLDLARQAATAAVDACAHLGFRTMATVVDSSGRPVAAMVADPGLARRLAYDSVHSAQIAAYFQDRSSRMADRIMDEPSVTYALRAHPQLAPFEAGGMPFPGPDTLGSLGVSGAPNHEHLMAIGVSGAPDGDRDEECGRDGVMAVWRELR